MSKERLGTDGDFRMLVVESGDGEYFPVVFNPASDDRMAVFVGGKLNYLRSHVLNLEARKRSIGVDKKAHGVARSEREISDVRESLDSEIGQATECMRVLEGDTLQPIRLVRNGEEIRDFRLSSFKTADEAEFWEFARENLVTPSNLSGGAEFWKFAKANFQEVQRMIEKFPGGVRWLEEGFELRFQASNGSSEAERSSAKRTYNDDFMRRYGDEVSDEQAEVLRPLMVKISRTFVF